MWTFFRHISRYRQLVFSVIIFSLFSFSVHTFATTYVAPGATLSPAASCTPGTCTVTPFGIGDTVNNATAGSLLFAGTAGVMAQDNSNLFWDDTNNRLGIGTVTPAYLLSVGKKTVGTVVFAGTLNDATIGGTYTGGATATYIVEIDAQGGDTYSVTKNGAVISSFNAITMGADVIDNGLTVTFLADSGHDLGDSWTFTVTVTGDISTGSVYRTGNDFFGAQEPDNFNLTIGKNASFGTSTAVNNTLLGISAGTALTTGGYNTLVGAQAGVTLTTGDSNVIVGNGAGAHLGIGTRNVAVGNSSGQTITSGSNNSFLGWSATAGGATVSNSVALGYQSVVHADSSIAIGAHATTTLANQMVIGGGATPIESVFIGSGVTSSTASSVAINASGGSGNNKAGGSLTFAGGKSTGSGAGGSIIFRTSPAGGAGIGVNALVDRMIIDDSGRVGIGTTTTIGAHLELVSSGALTTQIIRNTTSGGYSNLRLYNDQNAAGNSIQIAYSSAAYGTLVTNGPSGESGSFVTVGNFPLAIGTSNTARLTIAGSGDLTIVNADKGDGVAGPILTIGRNTNATNTAAGSINFLAKAGTAGYVWQDAAGKLRIHTSAPSNANDTAGVVVGDQTSTRETKQDITDYTDYSGALDMIANAPLHTFRYIKEVEGYGSDNPLAKTRIGFIADEVSPQFMAGNVIDQVSINGLLMASIKELDITLQNISSLSSNNEMSIGSYLLSKTEKFINGIVHAAKLIIGSPEARTGITLYDEVTGEPYCLSIANGATKTVAGECAVIVPVPPVPANVLVDEPAAEGPVDETTSDSSTAENPPVDAPIPETDDALVPETPAPVETPLSDGVEA